MKRWTIPVNASLFVILEESGLTKKGGRGNVRETGKEVGERLGRHDF